MMLSTPIVKSNIKEELDKIERAYSLQKYINDFLNEFDCDDIVFGFKDGNTQGELTEGYMEMIDTFDSLNEAIRYVDSPEMCLRYVCEDNEYCYYLGKYRKTLTECNQENVIFNIDKLEYVD